MSIAFVQAVNGGGDGSAATATTGSASFTAGNAVLVWARSNTNTIPTSVTDTAGNTYSLICSNRIADNEQLWLYVAKNITGHASNVITVTWAASQSFSYCVAVEVSGADTSVPVDILTNSKGASGSTTHTSHKFSTSSLNAIIFDGVQLSNTGTTWTAGSGYTIPSGGTSPSNVLVVQYKAVSALQSVVDATITNSATNNMGCIVAVLREPIVSGSGGVLCNPGMQGGMRG